MYKTIVVHVDDSSAMESRLQAAAQLANLHGAHLVGSAATGLSWPSYALLTGSMAVTPIDEFDAICISARASLRDFAERARQLGVESVEERLVEDEHRYALLLQSRYADLVVTSQDTGARDSVRGLPQYVALHGARPVLAVPPGYAGAPMNEEIVVGWDGSLQAVRAIAAALPLLAGAASVRLVLVNAARESSLHGDEPGADIALYLARHGVRVDVVLEHTTDSVGEALLAIAQRYEAGLLVTGAFGHSRYRELVMGGVTRVLLERSTVPVLVAH
ncbi:MULTISPECIES: universal stress protein [unclassified Massilia]|uniref:universal stress protein n=1 Tax=unclassified Massilia TaxID=2609279 RepID=UPI00177CFD79|nr:MULTISPECIES: universal stress protein [unclassified Massilia]MBD8533285.1 universal stress protein [Massilia sp. CFBP 13647]MBD8676657.1 universal stress protein [Massilia sp. CFBP 13721]